MSPARLEKLKADIAAYDADMAQFGDDLETSPELWGDAGSASARDLNARLDAIVIEARELGVRGTSSARRPVADSPPSSSM
jgi:hypothetical protein